MSAGMVDIGEEYQDEPYRVTAERTSHYGEGQYANKDMILRLRGKF